MIARRQQPGRNSKRKTHDGFTLVELSVAVAVLGVIMLGLGSAMLIAGRALPDASSPTASRIAAAGAAEQMVTELQYAVSVNQRAANMVEFGVPDRSGDEMPEIIRYDWSGTSGAPLTRQYNGGTPVAVLADVWEFSLSYNLDTVTTQIPQGTEGAQTTLSSYSSPQKLYDYPIADLEWYAEYFFPTLPGGTTSWKVTRVVITAKQDGAADGEARVQLQLPTAGKYPSGVVLEEKTLLESALLTTYSNQEFTFSTVGGLSPQQGLCLVIRWIANGTACRVRGRNSGVTATGIALAKSTNRGAVWSTLSSQSLLFTVYGTVTTAGTPQTQNTYSLSGVELKLRAGSDVQSIVQTGIKTLNRPEVTP